MVATAFAIQAIIDLEDFRGAQNYKDQKFIWARHFSNVLVKKSRIRCLNSSQKAFLLLTKIKKLTYKLLFEFGCLCVFPSFCLCLSFCKKTTFGEQTFRILESIRRIWFLVANKRRVIGKYFFKEKSFKSRFACTDRCNYYDKGKNQIQYYKSSGMRIGQSLSLAFTLAMISAAFNV